MNWRVAWAGVLLAGLTVGSPRAAAFEFYSELISPAIADAPIQVRIWVRSNVSAADEALALQGIQQALQLWEDVPTCRLQFEIDEIIRSAADPGKIAHQLRIEVCNAGECGGGATPPVGGYPGYWHGASALSTQYVAVGVHEIGHALGLHHSTISQAFAQAHWPEMHFMGNGTLGMGLDDMAGIAAAYPDPANPPLAAGGALRGRLQAADTADALSGVNVVAVNAATGSPAVARISGSWTDPGAFEIVGLPAGSYHLQIMDGHSYRGTMGHSVPSQADNFTVMTAGPFAVTVGQQVDLGVLPVTVWPLALDGQHVGPVQPTQDTIPLTPIGSALASAQAGTAYETWLHVQGGVRPLALSNVSGLPGGLNVTVADDPRGNARIHGAQYVRVHGTPQQSGPFTLRMTLTDARGTSQLFVVGPDTPQPPQFVPALPAQATAYPGMTFSLPVIATDVNLGDAITLTATIPSGMTGATWAATGGNGQLTWVPQPAHRGQQFAVTLRATDATQLFTTATVTVGVPANTAPSFDPMPDEQADEIIVGSGKTTTRTLEKLAIRLPARDADPEHQRLNTLQVAAAYLPAGAVLRRVGDVTQDGLVMAADAAALASHLAAPGAWTWQQVQLGDADASGALTSADASLLQAALAETATLPYSHLLLWQPTQAQAGRTYNLVLTVTDPEGASGSGTLNIAVAGALTAPNLLSNGGFESGETGWASWNSSRTLVSAPVYAGANAARFTVGGAPGYLRTNLVPTVAGRPYWIKAMVQTAGVTGAGAYGAAWWYGANGNLVRFDEFGHTTGTSNGWVARSSGMLVAPSGSTQVRIFLYTSPGSGTAYFDDVRLHE